MPQSICFKTKFTITRTQSFSSDSINNRNSSTKSIFLATIISIIVNFHVSFPPVSALSFKTFKRIGALFSTNSFVKEWSKTKLVILHFQWDKRIISQFKKCSRTSSSLTIIFKIKVSRSAKILSIKPSLGRKFKAKTRKACLYFPSMPMKKHQMSIKSYIHNIQTKFWEIKKIFWIL